MHRSTQHLKTRPASRPRNRDAFTLVELMIVLTIMIVMLSFSMPSFHRTVQQTRTDSAAATLRTIWTAERIYWLNNRTYSATLTELDALDLIDPNTLAPLNGFVFAITNSSATTFTATATPTGTSKWSGQLTLNEQGVIGGSIQAAGETDILPGLL
ncbi:MAG: prepilin-type N-terminal cleavage/methylation domain-containing protein [Planctomycetota bacterium]|nr:prepilin-type N-terminal cleavage/methylation domain-containing protein [Planctomycetota bacterium]